MVAVEEFQTTLKTHHLHARSASEARKIRSQTSGEVYHLNWIRKESRPETRDQLVTRKQSQVKPTSQLSLKISLKDMTLTIDNAYNSKIISNNDASIDIVDIESRKLLFVGAIVIVTEGPKEATLSDTGSPGSPQTTASRTGATQ